jgi:hypothetical protein
VKHTQDRKEKTTKETDKALLKKINLALVQTIASKED